MPRVFLSYARADAEVVDKVAHDLRKHGVDLWLDRENIEFGQAWQPQIEEAIARADFMLVFVSKASLSSAWVQREYQAGAEEGWGGTIQWLYH